MGQHTGKNKSLDHQGTKGRTHVGRFAATRQGGNKTIGESNESTITPGEGTLRQKGGGLGFPCMRKTFPSSDPNFKEKREDLEKAKKLGPFPPHPSKKKKTRDEEEEEKRREKKAHGDVSCSLNLAKKK